MSRFFLACPIAAFIMLAAAGCGDSSSSAPDGQGKGGGGGKDNGVCEPLSLYGRANAARSALCDQVTSCYGRPEDDALDCYVPAGSADGGIGIVVDPATPGEESVQEMQCLCDAASDTVTAYITCVEKADENLRECIAECQEDPADCAAEYRVTCGALRETVAEMMQLGGECYRGEPRE